MKTEIEAFANRCTALREAYFAKTFDNPGLFDATVEVKFGRKYAKLTTERSVYAFVDMKTGDIYKAASYNAPAKWKRGNITDASGGLNAMTPYGAKYLA